MNVRVAAGLIFTAFHDSCLCRVFVELSVRLRRQRVWCENYLHDIDLIADRRRVRDDERDDSMGVPCVVRVKACAAILIFTGA